MKFNSTLKNLVKTAFDTIGDLKTPVEYHHVISLGTYDATMDTVTPIEEIVDLEVPLLNISEKEISWAPVDTDGQKALVAASDISFEPSTSDWMIINGDKWEVKGKKPVTGNSMYTLFLQKV